MKKPLICYGEKYMARHPVIILLACLAFVAGCSQSDEKPYDVVINQGRVIDPLSELDAIRHIGLREGRIVKISKTPLTAKQMVEASGLSVAPGFIDYHWHCPAQACYEIGLKDGLTSAMDLEFGALGSEINQWYARREGAARINFGTSASAELARALVLDGNKADDALNAYISRGRGQKWAVHAANSQKQKADLEDMEQGRKASAIGRGITLCNLPESLASEVYELQKETAE